MKFYKALVAAFLFCAALNVHANPGAWMPEAKAIIEIHVEGSDDGKALIVIDGNVPADYVPSGCNSGGNRAFNVVHLNTDKGKGIYSLALTAYMGGKPVNMAVTCEGTRPLITNIKF
jgi:hypothetical protein